MRRASLVAIVVVLAAGLGVAGAKPPTRDAGSVPHQRAARVSGREVPLLRTAHSQTYKHPDGSYQARISTAPINYRDASGHWQPIDNKLQALSNGSLENRANSFKVDIPQAASGDVSVAHGGRRLGFSLIGANAAAPAADGAKATFPGALPQVDVAYQARGQSLKETLTLHSASAPSAYAFALDAPGLSASAKRSGGVVFRDAGGRVRFQFAAPWMQDSKGVLSRHAKYVVRETGGRQTVELQLDSAWLHDRARAFPVRVDPSVSGEPDVECQLISGSSANYNECGEYLALWVGRCEEQLFRGLLTIPSSEGIVEPEALVTDASLRFWLEEQTTSARSTIDLRGVTRAADSAATWNHATAGTAWTTPGGDLSSSVESTQTLGPELLEEWSGMGATRLAQAWVDGSDPLREVMIKGAHEEVEHADLIESFEIVIDYRFRQGIDTSQYTYDHTELSDGSTLDYNAGSGNVTLSTNDGFGSSHDPNLMGSRYWNTQNTQEPANVGTFGLRARGDIGTVELHDGAFGASYLLEGLTGADEVFVKDSGGSFAPTDGKDVTLTAHEDGSVTLNYRETDTVWEFDNSSPHHLVKVRETDGYTVEATYTEAGRLATLTDSEELEARFAYDEAGDLETVTDQEEGVRRYTFDGSHRLTSYTSPEEQETRYRYDGSGRLERIDLPDGTAMRLSYFGGSGVVGSLTPVNAENRAGEPITLEGETEYSTITHPREHPITYFPNKHLGIDVSQTGDGPGITAEGDVVKLEPTYTQGETPYVIHTRAASVPNGVEEVHLTANESTIETLRASSCSPRCPQELSGNLTFDARSLSEGTYDVKLHAEDGESNTSHGDTWSVHVDRTAPTLSASDFGATYEEGETEIDWNPGTDPNLADESPGSPIVSYRYRYQIGAGLWSSWTSTDTPSFTLESTTDEETIGVDVQAVDAAGNVGLTASDTITSEEAPTTVEGITEATGTPEAPWMEAEPDPFEGYADGPDSYSNPPAEEESEGESLLRRDSSGGSGYRERLCPFLSAPCGRYDGKAAAAYAMRWYNDRNHDYGYYGDVDCTNFASQALKAGGLRFMRAHGVNTPNGHDGRNSAFIRGEGSWWSYFMDIPPASHYPRLSWASKSFTVSHTLYRHLIEYGLARDLRSNEKPRPGDLVFYNLTGTSRLGFDHTQVVVRNDRTGIHVAQHAPDRVRTMAEVLQDHNRPDYRPGIDRIYVFVRPVHAAADIPAVGII